MPHLLAFLLLLCLMIPAAKLAGALATRLGQPAVFGEILAGLVLGPTVLDVLSWSFFIEPAAPGEGLPLLQAVRDFADIGVILLMFVAGMETDLGEVRRVGRVAFWTATGGVLLPMAGGAALATLFGWPLFWQGIFIGTILAATSVSISAQTLIELNALRSTEGSTILGAAVIDDVMGILVLSIVVAFARATGETRLAALGLITVRMGLFFAAAILLGRLLTPLLRRATHLGVSQGRLGIVLTIAFLYAWAAEAIGGIAAITGSYIAGVLIARTPFRQEVDRDIHPLTYSMFVPVFFVSIGLQADGRALGAHAGFTLALVAVAIVAKAVGCGGFAWLSGFTMQQAVRVGAGMISRGEVGLIVAGYGIAHNLIPRDIFSASVIMVLATTMVTPPLLRLVFPHVPRKRPHIVEETIGGPPEETHRHT